MPQDRPLLEIDHVTHSYGDGARSRPDGYVVDGFSFVLHAGEIACLLGSSGCGKTTVLRLIAGFESPLGGSIRLDGATIADSKQSVPPEQRHIGMMFQDYSLFPHLNVAQNIAFGLHSAAGKARLNPGRDQVAARVNELLELVGLVGRAEAYPHELSGGQQQRVALARALAPKPHLLLLDEPFSSLDVELRERLSLDVRAILKAAGMAAILVTHDQDEAFVMADVVGVMKDGHIEQWDTPYLLYHRPATRYVAEFIGQGVFLPGEVLTPHTVEVELGVLDSDVPMECQKSCADCERDCSLDILLRPDDVIHDDASPVLATVMSKAFRGADFLYTLRLQSGRDVLSLVPSHHNHPVGEKIGIRLNVDHVVGFSSGA
jgi:iron(III) transport system ATP-binding protein